MTEKLSQERLEEISREPLTATNNDVLAMADELVERRLKEQGVRLIERDGETIKYRSV